MTVNLKALLAAPAALAVAIAAGPAAAHDPEAASSAHAPAAAGTVKNTTAAAALTIVKDPDTGVLRAPTAEEAAALLAAPRFTSFARVIAPAPRAYVTPSGGRGMTLGESTLGSALARHNADGTLNETCVTGPASLADKITLEAKKELPHD